MHFFSRIILPFVLLSYIAIESYLKLHHTSLCGQVGCKLAGELLRFNPIYLNYFALVSLFVLTLFGYLSLKNTLFKTLFFIGLYAAIAFEATIISYQYIVNPEICLFCLGIFSSLLLIALLSHIKYFPFVIAGVLAIFIGINTLSISKNRAYVTHEGLYLIHSKSCGHCQKVKKYFAEHNITYTAISIKEVNARAFLKFIDISTIPVLLIKKPTGIKILTGDKKILSYFDKPLPSTEITASSAAPKQSSALGLPSELFDATSEPGCAITVTQTPACEDKNNSQTSQH
ncbi:MAG TPA: hypothetical protein EYH42_09300 [Sulfurovum sp.]|nr:hypothetical protein [Sulfurovum sp.]